MGALVGAFVGALIAVADASDCSECMIPNVSWVFIGAIVGAVIVIRVL